jgi:hypothetical protein
MDFPNLQSTSAEALRAELHRAELLREAATSRLARAASAGTTSSPVTGPGFVRRVRTAFTGLDRPAQVDSPDCV